MQILVLIARQKMCIRDSVLIDQEDTKKLFEQLAKANFKSMSRMELIHASMSGQLAQYDFDYDEAFAKVKMCIRDRFIISKSKSFGSV